MRSLKNNQNFLLRQIPPLWIRPCDMSMQAFIIAIKRKRQVGGDMAAIVLRNQGRKTILFDNSVNEVFIFILKWEGMYMLVSHLLLKFNDIIPMVMVYT